MTQKATKQDKGKQTGRIGVKDFDKILSKNIKEKEIVWNELPLRIKMTIPFEEFIQLTSVIADGCFTSDGSYSPQNYDYILRLALVQYFTNINLPEDNSKRFRILYETDIFKTLLTEGNTELLKRVRITVDDLISERKEKANSSATVLKLIFDALKWIPETFEGVSKEEIDDFIEKANKAGKKGNAE